MGTSPADDYPRWFRWAFGRPRIRHAAVWAVLGACLAALGLMTFGHRGNAWLYFVAAAAALAFAALQLVIAIHDLKRGLGGYATPTFTQEDPEE